MVPLADILRQHWPAYLAKFGAAIPSSHRAAVAAMLHCHTAALGGQVYRCACGQTHFAYHSCNHRACPQCGHHDATVWIAKQKARLLPVPYFLVTFTAPEQLRMFMRAAQKFWFTLWFQESAATLQDVAAREKYLGATLGMLGALHTWTRQLIYHPHIHYLIPGGGLTSDGLRWKRTKADFFLPQAVLAMRFRTRIKQRLQREQPRLLARVPAKVWRLNWVVDVEPVGGGEGALKYLAAYLSKTAITAQRLVACDAKTVTFRHRDRKSGAWKLCRVSGEEFVRRFLQHVLPDYFRRMRQYGWWSAAAKNRWDKILFWLHWTPPVVPPPAPRPPVLCPRCQQPMICVGQLARPPP